MNSPLIIYVMIFPLDSQALCNYLKRPIHVYELAEREEDQEETDLSNQPIRVDKHPKTNKHPALNYKPLRSSTTTSSSYSNTLSHNFQLRRMACFGSPKYDRQSALHILSADSRFPDIAPGQQLASGNHFLALIPESVMCSIGRGEDHGGSGNSKRKKTLKKGASVRGGGGVDGDTDGVSAVGMSVLRKRRKRRRRGRDGAGEEEKLIEGTMNSSEEEEGSFFSHGIFKLIRSTSERRRRSKSATRSIPSSAVKDNDGIWRWVLSKWIDGFIQLLNCF